jgi:hypothetical protein
VSEQTCGEWLIMLRVVGHLPYRATTRRFTPA